MFNNNYGARDELQVHNGYGDGGLVQRQRASHWAHDDEQWQERRNHQDAGGDLSFLSCRQWNRIRQQIQQTKVPVSKQQINVVLMFF